MLNFVKKGNFYFWHDLCKSPGMKYLIVTLNILTSFPVLGQTPDYHRFKARLEQEVGYNLNARQSGQLAAAVDYIDRIRPKMWRIASSPPTPPAQFYEFMVCAGAKVAAIGTAQGAICFDVEGRVYLVYGLGGGVSGGIKGDIGVLAVIVNDGEISGTYQGGQAGVSFFHLGANGGYYQKEPDPKFPNVDSNIMVRVRYTPGLGLDFSEATLHVRQIE
jgi:hypothetical protein